MNRKRRNTIRRMILVILLTSLVPCVFAAQSSFESAGVGRVVGDSVDEVVGQLRMDDAFLQSASVYTDDDAVGRRAVEVNKTVFSYFGNASRFVSRAWSWDNIKADLAGAGKNELLVIQTKGELADGTPRAGDGTHTLFRSISPPSWPELKKISPVFFSNSDYSGMYLPKSVDGPNSFVGSLGQDSMFFAPVSVSDPEFLKSFICHLGRNNIDGKSSLGEILRDSRNAYYWQSSRASGLALMSYEYYGNPVLNARIGKINESALIENCKPYIQEAKASSIGSSMISAGSASASVYRMEEVVDFSGFYLERDGNYTVVGIPGTLQRRAEDMHILPQKAVVVEFPLRTIISNVSFVFEDPAELLINLSSWNGTSASEPVCWNESVPADVGFRHLFSGDSELLVAEIFPVEVVNCSEGRVRIYRKARYSADYALFSPVLIREVSAPAHAIPNSMVVVNVTVRSMKPSKLTGVLSVYDGYGVSFNSSGVELQPSETRQFSMAFTASQSISAYSMKFFELGEEKARKGFMVYPEAVSLRILSPLYQAEGLNVPVTLLADNLLSLPVDAGVEVEVIGGSRQKQVRLQRLLKPGINAILVNMENLSFGTYMLHAKITTSQGSYMAAAPLNVERIEYIASSATLNRFSDGTAQKTGSGNVSLRKTAIIRNASIEVSGNSGPVDVSIYVAGFEAAKIMGALSGTTATISGFADGRASETVSSTEGLLVVRNISLPKNARLQNVSINVGTTAFQASAVQSEVFAAAENPKKEVRYDGMPAYASPSASISNISAQVSSGTYCADWSVASTDSKSYGVDEMYMGHMCSARLEDVDNDGYAEKYVLVGSTLTTWARCHSYTAAGYNKVAGFVDYNWNNNLGCTYNHDSDTRKSTSYCDGDWETSYYDTTYNSPTSLVYTRDVYCLVEDNDGYRDSYGFPSQQLVWCYDTNNNNQCDTNDRKEPFLILNCGVDNDCANDKYCKKPTISNPTSYYCDTPACTNLNCPEWKTQQNAYSGHMCSSQCIINSGRCEIQGQELDQTHYCDSDHYIREGVKKILLVNGNASWAGFGVRVESIDLTSQVAAELNSCIPDSDGYCNIQIQFTSNFSIWELKINSVEAKYIPDIDLSGSVQNSLNACEVDMCNVTIAAFSEAGMTTISNLKIEHETYNYMPIASLNGNIAINEGETANLNLKAMDIANENLSVEFAHPFNNLGIWHAGYGSSGFYQAMVKVSDGTYTIYKFANISVADVNRKPSVEFIGDIEAVEGENITLLINASDPDNDNITYSVNDTRLKKHNAAEFVWQTKLGDSGNYSVLVSVSDGKSSAWQKVMISVEPAPKINGFPIIHSLLPNETVTIVRGGYQEFIVVAADPDNDTLYYLWLLNTTVVSTQPAFILDTSNLSRNYILTVAVNDGSDTSYASLNITVVEANSPPLIFNISSITAKEGETIVITPYATDRDDDIITLSFSSPFNQSGIWTANYSSSGNYRVGITASDGHHNVTEIFELRVLNVNRAPAIIGEDGIIMVVRENEKAEFEYFPVNLTADGEPWNGKPPACEDWFLCVYDLDNENSVANDDSRITISYSYPFDSLGGWQTDYSSAGDYNITITASDGEQSSEWNLVVRVENVNRPPIVSLMPNVTNITIKENDTIRMEANASDPDGDSVTYLWMLNGLIVSEEPNYTFTSNIGAHLLFLVVSDGKETAGHNISIKVVSCLDSETRPCPLQEGVCAGSYETCTSNEWNGCAGQYGTEYEPEEALCDGKDNDCNGLIDENIFRNSTCGRCGYTIQKCESGAWTDSGCSGEGECEPGSNETEACGYGRTRSRVCGIGCDWREWGECVNSRECNEGCEYANVTVGIGWNFISLPLLRENYSASDMLHSLPCSEVVKLYNNSFVRSLNSSKDNFQIRPGYGYFIKCGSYATEEYSGYKASLSIEMGEGWNGIGVGSFEGNASSLLSELEMQGLNCSQIAKWQYGSWQGHVKGFPFNNFHLKPDEGYLVKCAGSKNISMGTGQIEKVEKSTLQVLKTP